MSLPRFKKNVKLATKIFWPIKTFHCKALFCWVINHPSENNGQMKKISFVAFCQNNISLLLVCNNVKKLEEKAYSSNQSPSQSFSRGCMHLPAKQIFSRPIEAKVHQQLPAGQPKRVRSGSFFYIPYQGCLIMVQQQLSNGAKEFYGRCSLENICALHTQHTCTMGGKEELVSEPACAPPNPKKGRPLELLYCRNCVNCY